MPGYDPEPALAKRLAHELGECRQRGLEWLDVATHNQRPVSLPELEHAASEYAQATRGTSRGRISQIKKLLRDCLNGMEHDNPDDAALIRDLLFGEDEHTITKAAGELLDAAKRKRGDPSEARFRNMRHAAFLRFSYFVLDFVPAAESQEAGPAETSRDQEDSRQVAARLPIGRLWLSPPLEAVLRFSLNDPGSGKLTIEEHQAIIARHGSCWWGWFRAAHDSDHSVAIAQRLNDCDIGLWERSSGLFYIGKCERASADNGSPIPPPEAGLTPAYYRSSRWPAWLKLSAIRLSTHQEIAERFGDLPNTNSTIYWGPEPPRGPIKIPAQGESILHLSDLHFGQYHRWSTSRTRRGSMTTEQAITRALNFNNVDPASIGLVVICGNFCSGEPAKESYEEALSFIDDLSKRLPNITRSSFVIVPGADDFVRPGDRERAVQLLYREFHQALYGNPDLDIGRLRQYEFTSFLVNVLPVNSVKILGTDERDEGFFGHGYDSQLDEMLRGFLSAPEHGPVVNVVAAHHHLVPATPRLPASAPQDSVSSRLMPGIHDARDVFVKLNASRVSLFLHGHLHEADWYLVSSDADWQTAVCGAGSAGAARWWLESKYRDNHSNAAALYAISNGRINGRMFTFDEDFRRPSLAKSFDIPVGLAQRSPA